MNAILLKLLAFVAVLALVLADDPTMDTIEGRRQILNVYAFISPDYPAMFTLITGVTVALTVGIVFIVVGLLTMDPGKDSIIYRMTTTRMKKD